MPLVTPTTVSDNRDVQDLQAVTETNLSLTGAELLNVNNKASAVPEHKTTQIGQAELLAAAAASSIVSRHIL